MKLIFFQNGMDRSDEIDEWISFLDEQGRHQPFFPRRITKRAADNRICWGALAAEAHVSRTTAESVQSNDSPLGRSIGLTGVIRWFIALALVIACGAAASAGRWGMAGALAVFAVGAAVLGYRARRAAM